MDSIIDWLLEGPAWVQYRTRVDLLEQPEQDPRVCMARASMLADPQIIKLVAELEEWPGQVLSSHKSAGLLMHKLTFVADVGLTKEDPGVKKIIGRIYKSQSREGPFQVPINISESFGGSGKEMWGWALCDAPITLYGLLKFGSGEDARVKRSVETLTNLVRDNGWPCAVSPELGKWHGPGRKGDPCPYANMVMLKALAQIGWKDSPATRAGSETALRLWTESREQHPYMFYMGTDFRKLKAPFIWYDILHLLEVLTQFPWLKGDSRLRDMIHVVQEKDNGQGRYTPESIWKAWSNWDLGQKKEPSRGLTFLIQRILKRYTGMADQEKN